MYCEGLDLFFFVIFYFDDWSMALHQRYIISNVSKFKVQLLPIIKFKVQVQEVKFKTARRQRITNNRQVTSKQEQCSCVAQLEYHVYVYLCLYVVQWQIGIAHRLVHLLGLGLGLESLSLWFFGFGSWILSTWIGALESWVAWVLMLEYYCDSNK